MQAIKSSLKTVKQTLGNQVCHVQNELEKLSQGTGEKVEAEEGGKKMRWYFKTKDGMCRG